MCSYKRKSLILITNGFPFGESEQSFLKAEFECLIKNYNVTILTLQTLEPIIYPINKNVKIKQYSYKKIKGMRLFITLPELLKILNQEYVQLEIKNALKGCNFNLKKKRLKEVLSFGLQAEQLKEVLDSFILETSADIIYTYWCFPITLTASKLKEKYPNLKVITRFHGGDLYNERKYSLWQPFRSTIAEKCDRLIFACDFGKKYFLKYWGKGYEEKLITAYLGSREFTDIKCNESNCLVLLSCSFMIPLKRIHRIIETLAIFPDYIKVYWHHIGDGVLFNELKEQASNLLSKKLNISWKFWGYVENIRLQEVYQEIVPDVFITVTQTEGGVPVSIQEAFSAGIPAIGTAVGGIPEVIQTGYTGYLLSENPDTEEIAKAIMYFYEATLEQKTVMKNATYQLWKSKFNAEKNAEKMVQILEQI